MRFFRKMPRSLAIKNAAPAFVLGSARRGRGFTLIEVLVVVTLIGILSALAYASIGELILTSRAKETAQTMRSFAERALADAKRQNKTVTIKLVGSDIVAEVGDGEDVKKSSQNLGSGFKMASVSPDSDCANLADGAFINSVVSDLKIGVSGLAEKSGYFVACGAGDNYCGAAVKAKENNSFVACIKRKKSSSWEAL